MPGNWGIARHGARARVAALAALLLAVAASASVEARRKVEPAEPIFVPPASLFGMTAVEHPPARNFAKWTDVLDRYERERPLERQLCERGDCALVQWRSFLDPLKRADALAQLRAVNAYLNRVPYKTDEELYGAEDYWATPRELFARGGDCEDYAIAKYFSLRALGWPAERLRVVVVHDRTRDLVHAALVAYHGGTAYLLDIEISEVTDIAEIERYIPIFAISENGWWSFRPGETIVTKTDAQKTDARTETAKGETPSRAPAKSMAAVDKDMKATAATKAAAHKGARPAPAQRSVIRSVPRLPQSYRPPPVVRQLQQSEPDEEEEEEKDNTPVLEPGERIEEVFLPGAR